MAQAKEARVNVRVPLAIVARIDALVPKARSLPECALLGSIDRSKVARVAMLRGLDVLEAEISGKPTKGPRRPA